MLLVAVLVGVGAAARAETADAFIGENLVINPVTKELTGPAKTIITNPTFLPEELGKAAVTGGAELETGVASVFQGAGLLPVLGSVAAFGIGAGVGSYICHSVIELEGCWFYGSESADPAKTAGPNTWVLVKSKLTSAKGAVIWPYEYAYGVTGPINLVDPSTECPTTVPAGASAALLSDENPAYCIVGGKPKGGKVDWYVRGSATNRDLKAISKAEAEAGGLYTGSDYCPFGASSIGTCTKTPPATWAKTLPAAIGNSNLAPSAARDGIGQAIAHRLEPAIKDPLAGEVTIPSCDEFAWGACKAALEEVDLESIREDLDWSEVTTTTPDQVQELQPAKSTEVERGTAVKVITNPDEAGMPIVVPQPEVGETYDHYAARLNPALTPERHVLEAAFIDPAVGPNGVVAVSPKPETRLDPGTTHKVDVSTNPADAPAPAAAWVPPGLPSIDMSPISGIPSPCTVFPFGLFCWMGEAFGQFNTSGTCPHFEAPVADTGADFEVTMCGDTAETIMGYLRPALLLAFIVGCGVMFARGTKAIGGSD